MRNERGFTLIELAMVVVVLGVLVAIVLPNLIRFKDRAARAACVSNQHNIFEVSTLYVEEQEIDAAVFNVSDLQAAGLGTEHVADCPESHDEVHTDYTITVSGGKVTAIRCEIEPAPHVWNAPA